MVDLESWIRTLTPYMLMLLAGAVTVIRMNQRISTLEKTVESLQDLLREDIKAIKEDIKNVSEKLNVMTGGWNILLDEHKRNHNRS